MAVGGKGTVYVATVAGLAKSTDKGANWSFIRGRDYAAKVTGRYEPIPGWTEPPATALDQLLPEDYVNAVAEDRSGLLWPAPSYGCVGKPVSWMVMANLPLNITQDEVKYKFQNIQYTPIIVPPVGSGDSLTMSGNSVTFGQTEVSAKEMITGKFGSTGVRSVKVNVLATYSGVNGQGHTVTLNSPLSGTITVSVLVIKFLGLTVKSGADIRNVIQPPGGGNKNWAALKSPGRQVVVMARLEPDTDAAGAFIA